MSPKVDSKPKGRRRQRGWINAEDIVAGAFEVARRGSLEQLSMPSLAEHLDVGVTSIYWYFRKKDDLLNTMTDVAFDHYLKNLPQVSDDATWQEAPAERNRTTRQTHCADHILSGLLFIRTSTYSREATRRVFEQEEKLLQRLIDAGFSPEESLFVFNTASVYTRGIVIHDRILGLSNTPTLDGRQRRMTDWSSMPVLDSLNDEHPRAGTSDEDFEFGIARLIDGFEALLARQGADRGVPRTVQSKVAKPLVGKVGAVQSGRHSRRSLQQIPARRDRPRRNRRRGRPRRRSPPRSALGAQGRRAHGRLTLRRLRC